MEAQEIKKGIHIIHAEHGPCSIVRHDRFSRRVLIKELVAGEWGGTHWVKEKELEILKTKDYDGGSDPVSRHDLVAIEGDTQGLWRVTGFEVDEDSGIRVKVEKVMAGESVMKVVKPSQITEPSDDVVSDHGYFRTGDGRILLDWRKVGLQTLLEIPTSRDWWGEGEGKDLHYTKKDVYWAFEHGLDHLRTLAQEDGGHYLKVALSEELSELILEFGDITIEDDSFGYEYGDIVGTHECYSLYIEIDEEIEVDVLVLEKPELEGTEEVWVHDDDDVEAEVEVDLSGLTCEEVELEGQTFYHVTGTFQ